MTPDFLGWGVGVSLQGPHKREAGGSGSEKSCKRGAGARARESDLKTLKMGDGATSQRTPASGG